MITQHLASLRDALIVDLIERDVPMRLALLAAVAGEHLLLIGPPGTAKSTIARRLRLAFSESTLFERLLTRFTVPEELFGPLSIKGLEDDRYERLTQGYLPTASVAFLDEIFKANSAILNALLTLLQEREFDNGTRREKTPLVAVIAASNELPEGAELAALYDRFLLRACVPSVSKEGFGALLGLRGDAPPEVPSALRLSAADLDAIRTAAGSVEIPEEVMTLLSELRDFCLAEGVPVSDRRFRKIVKLLQFSAFTNGRDKVSVWDCWLLQHCAWSKPEEREKIYDWYAGRVGTSGGTDAASLTRLVTQFEGLLKRDRDARMQRQDEEGRLLYLLPDGKLHPAPEANYLKHRGGAALYLAPPNAGEEGRYGDLVRMTERTNDGKGYTESELAVLHVEEKGRWVQFGTLGRLGAYTKDRANWLTETQTLKPAIGPMHHKRAHIDACLRDVEGLRRDVATYEAQVVAQIRSLHREIETHLWVTKEFAGPAARTLEETRATVERLRERIVALEKGFASLPVESAASVVAPSPSASAKGQASPGRPDGPGDTAAGRESRRDRKV